MDQRSRAIFKSLVDSYLQTGQPVGSRTLAAWCFLQCVAGFVAHALGHFMLLFVAGFMALVLGNFRLHRCIP